MADFQLELDVFANTAKLEKGLKAAEEKVSATSNKIDKMSSEQAGFGKFVVGAAKAAAAFGAIEVGAGVVSTLGQSLKGVMASFAGDTEKAERAFAGALDAAKQLPFGIGGTIDKVNQLALALAGVEDTLVEIAELEAEIRDYEARKAVVLSILGTMRDIRKEMEMQLALLQEQDDYKREILAVELETQRAIEELQRKRDEALAAGVAEEIVVENYEKALAAILAVQEQKIANIKADQEAARLAEEEAKRAQEQAEREAELNRQAEEHQKQIIAMEKQAQKDREAAAAAQKKAEEEQLAFVNARLKMEEEIAEARVEAEQMAAGATASFATAGGSFTAAASAQVNEAKLLTRISQQSRDFLAQIMMNTAQMAGGLNLA